MPSFGKAFVLPIALSAALTAPAVAQQDCEIDRQTPAQMFAAYDALVKAQNAPDKTIAQSQLRGAMRFLSSDLSRNPDGKTLVMGQVLAWWLNLDGTPLKTTRSYLGYLTSGNDSVDIINTVDSLFKIVETKAPSCTEELRAYRRGRTWQTLVQSAINQLNADQTDSAEASARLAMKLSKELPYTHLVLAGVAQKRGKDKEAIALYKDAIREAETAAKADTEFVSNKWMAIYSLGTLALDAAEDPKNAADKEFFINEAKASLTALLEEKGRMADFARAGLVKLAVLTGDTASVRAAYREQVANADKQTFSQLIQAGAAAAMADWNDDAMKLFEAALAKAPYHRDALYNLSRLYVLGGTPTKAFPLLERLIEVDPNGEENYKLMRVAYNALRGPIVTRYEEMRTRAAGMGAQPARQKALVDTLNIVKDSADKLIDPILKAAEMIDSLKAKVAFTEYSPAEGKVVVAGTILNPTDEAKSYTIKIEFLDKGGNVVDTKTAIVPTEARRSGDFSVTGAGENIVAFRYPKLN